MGHIRVSTVIDVDIGQLWLQLEDITRHTSWMADARRITITSPQRSGVGTTFDCETGFGPLTMTDEMVVTEWEPPTMLGVDHVGLVKGSGRFTLAPSGPRRTEFTWTETLDYPLWMGGPLRDPVGDRVLSWVWRRNLRSLKQQTEARYGETP